MSMPRTLRNRYVLAVHDARATAEFFVGKLGFEVRNTPPGWVFVERDGVMILVGEYPDDLSPAEFGCHDYFGNHHPPAIPNPSSVTEGPQRAYGGRQPAATGLRLVRYIVGPFGGYAGSGRRTSTRYGRGLLPATATTSRCRTPSANGAD